MPVYLRLSKLYAWSRLIFFKVGYALFEHYVFLEACNSKAGKPGDMNTEAF